ncbi:YopX family protein [Levilactobacillus brevis]|uniref:YopX family protein n=1 Tax=Levilactobacillus brevis TaxID=1580 RepID=UPI002074195B|nr:YopX family protein [Levilactobacillus brevis]
MYRAYIKDIDEFDYNDVPHKGHFVYGNLIKGNTNDDTDAIVGDLIEINDEYVNVEWWQSIKKGSAEQSTGLKDVNGNEIYVGDILEFGSVWLNGDESDPQEEDHTGIVEYHPEYASYVVNCNEMIYPLEQMASFDGYSVRGNVHENPELLEA